MSILTKAICKQRLPAEDDASHNAAHEDAADVDAADVGDDGTNDICSTKGGMEATSPSRG